MRYNMLMPTRWKLTLGLLAFMVVPSSASAFELYQTPAIFTKVFIGLFLTMIMLTLMGGVVMYFSRLGTWPSYRDDAIKILEWAVVMMFTLVIVVAVGQFIERDPAMVARIAGIAAFLGLLWFIFGQLKPKEEASSDDKKPAAKKPAAGGH